VHAVGLIFEPDDAIVARPVDGPTDVDFAVREQQYIMNGGQMLVPLPELRYIDVAHTTFREET